MCDNATMVNDEPSGGNDTCLHRSMPSSPEDVLARCRHLLTELERFARAYEAKKRHHDYRQKCDFSHFRSDIEQEAKHMEKLIKLHTGPERDDRLVQASNLPYWEALWNTAKRNRQIISLRRHSSPIDIVCDSGTKWIKVSTINERRLLMEMAKQGWDWAGSDDESDEESIPARVDDYLDISLVKLAVHLRNMAREARVRFRYPKVHFVLTRINPGNKDIDLILDRIRATGASLETADQLVPAPPLDVVLDSMVLDDFKFFTPTLNVDCTLLLAIVSDISHGQVKEEAWFNRNVRNQIKIEEKEQLMEKLLWPAIRERKMVCTTLAAQRMREIVNTIGTATERERTKLLMGDPSLDPTEDLQAAFQSLSGHTVPLNWRLPVEIIDERHLVNMATPLQLKAVEDLVDINRSVFLYGWLTGLTTITSNRLVPKTIERAVEEYKSTDEDAGPDVWVCPMARSLVAKEKLPAERYISM